MIVEASSFSTENEQKNSKTSPAVAELPALEKSIINIKCAAGTFRVWGNVTNKVTEKDSFVSSSSALSNVHDHLQEFLNQANRFERSICILYA